MWLKNKLDSKKRHNLLKDEICVEKSKITKKISKIPNIQYKYLIIVIGNISFLLIILLFILLIKLFDDEELSPAEKIRIII